MQLRYRYRLYPTDEQCRALAQAFGNARVAYNDAVRARQVSRSGEIRGGLCSVRRSSRDVPGRAR